MQVIPVVLGSYYNAYSVVREFGENGISSILVTHGERNFVQKSKFLKRTIQTRDVNDDERGFIDDLISLGKELSPDRGMFFPTHDEELMAIAKYKNELAQFFDLPFSDYETLNQIMDKDYFSDKCKRLGIPTIRDMKVCSFHESEIALKDLGVPIVVKVNQYDLKTIQAFGRKIDVFEKESDYLDSMRLFYDVIPDGELLVQEYIIDSDRLMPNVNSFTDREGNLKCVFVSEKVRQYPPQRGTSTATYSMDPEDTKYTDIIEYSRIICKEFKFYGLFGIEFKYDPKDGKYKIIEMNCRAEFPNYLQTLVGQNMAYEIYKYHLGQGTDIPYYPIVKSASCYVPVLDKFYVTKSNKYDYPAFTMTKAEWKRSILKPVTLYGVTPKDIRSFVSAYLFEFKNSLLIIYRAKNHIPENISTKEYLKSKFRGKT